MFVKNLLKLVLLYLFVLGTAGSNCISTNKLKQHQDCMRNPLVIKQAEFLLHVSKLIEYIHDNNLIATGGELYRTMQQQQLYLQQGLSVTENSRHLRRLAIDLNFFKPCGNGNYRLTYSKKIIQKIGNYWESLHADNKWGGNWKRFRDTTHFERYYREPELLNEKSSECVHYKK